MSENSNIPRVVLVGLASCYGCQINITNIEQHLLDVLGQIDMRYWQLTSSDPMPEKFDVAVIEGAATTEDAVETVKRLREAANCVITIGACAKTAGIPGMAAAKFDGRAGEVYGDVPAQVQNDYIEPKAISEIIDVDYEVNCCPIDPYDFVRTLHHALRGSNIYTHTSTLCGECKSNERGCFYARGELCLGLVTQSGCGARCPSLGRPCSGCAGMSKDANLETSRKSADKAGIGAARFDKALEIFNQKAALISNEADNQKAALNED